MTHIQLSNETRVSNARLAEEIGVNQSTIFRWRLRGWQGVRLDCIRLGKNWYTTREEFARFINATNWSYAVHRPIKRQYSPLVGGV